jgi:hypothetical protein
MNNDTSSWAEVQYPERAPGKTYSFRRGYKVEKAGQHENATQYSAFEAFLRLKGLRNFVQLSELTGHKAITLSKWARKFGWEKRAADWEKDQLALAYRDVDKLKREAHRQAIEEFRNSSERQARMMSRVSEDLVRILGKRIAKADEQNEEIPMHMVGGLLRAASGLNEQSREAWGNALGVNELLEVVETEIDKVRVQELDSSDTDPYYIEVDE